MQKLFKYFQQTYLLVMLGVAVSMTACKKDDGETPVVAGPTITVTADATPHKAGETVKIKYTVVAPGKLKEVKVGTTSITTFPNETNATLETDYMIPADAAAGNHEVTITATDKQNPAKTAEAKAVVIVEATEVGPCVGFDEGAVITGEGKVAISDFTAADAGLMKEFVINNPADKGGVGVANPAGCGKVLEFNKTPNEWDGWNGFKVILKQALSAADFLSFARAGATKVLKVDIYRAEKAGAGAFPAEGIRVNVNLGNVAKFKDHPVGRSQYLVGTLTKDKEWETVTFEINEGEAGNIDAAVTDAETDLIEFIPAGGKADDGGLYYFDNIRIENK